MTVSTDWTPQSHEILAAQLELVRRQFEKVKADVSEFAAPLTDEQLNWRPPSGGWSIGECFVHLNVTNAQYLAPLDAAIATARAKKRLGRGPFKMSWLGKYMIKTMEPPPKRRFRAPRNFTPEPKEYRVGIVVPTFITFQDQLIERVVSANGIDLARTKVRSQAVKLLRFSLAETFAILAAHERRHVWQAKQVAAQLGFPSS